MKSLFSLGVLIAVAMAEVGNSEPQPTPIPNPGEMEEPALPTPDATPGDDGPNVLPKLDELPARPRAEHSARVSSERVSKRPSLGEQAIDVHEEAKVHEAAGSTGPSKDDSRRSSRIAAREAHHMSRSVPGRHRYERYKEATRTKEILYA